MEKNKMHWLLNTDSFFDFFSSVACRAAEGQTERQTSQIQVSHELRSKHYCYYYYLAAAVLVVVSVVHTYELQSVLFLAIKWLISGCSLFSNFTQKSDLFFFFNSIKTL